MTPDRIRGFCPRCRHQQTFERTQVHHLFHFFLSVVTFGLWLISWISIYIGHRMHPWRCVQCNWNRPVFDAPKPAVGQGESGKTGKDASMRVM